MWSPDDPNRPKVTPDNSSMSSESPNSSQEENVNNHNITQPSQSQNPATTQRVNQNLNAPQHNFQVIGPDIFYLQMFAVFIGIIFSLFLFFKILRSK
jgi:hypothetical protein